LNQSRKSKLYERTWITYEEKKKIFFSDDTFGKFGTLDINEDWTCEARRYYFNIVGRYGMQVQLILKNIIIEKKEDSKFAILFLVEKINRSLPKAQYVHFHQPQSRGAV